VYFRCTVTQELFDDFRGFEKFRGLISIESAPTIFL
jgi:hypothetical protein